VIKLVGDFTRFVSRIDGTKDGSHAGDRIAGDDEFGPVRHEQAHALALLHSKRLQRVRELIGEGIQLTEGEHAVTVGNGHMFRPGSRALGEQLVIRYGWIG
jgi:hypothetical protein